MEVQDQWIQGIMEIRIIAARKTHTEYYLLEQGDLYSETSLSLC